MDNIYMFLSLTRGKKVAYAWKESRKRFFAYYMVLLNPLITKAVLPFCFNNKRYGSVHLILLAFVCGVSIFSVEELSTLRRIILE